MVATPLGNLRDLSPRALDVLAAVDCIAAEDTRHSQRLLDAFGLRTPLLAVHEHNEQSAAGRLIERLQAGEHIALISDAGTPAVSDPGARVVHRVRDAGFAVLAVPGPCAAVAAVSIAGFDAGEGGFRFVGFLPAREAARRTALTALREERMPLVLYESPHRIVACLADLTAVLGAEREVLIARELTKLHEQSVRLPLGEVAEWLAADANRQRGEFVLVVAAAPPPAGLSAEALRVLALLQADLPLKTAVRLAAEISGEPRKALYAEALARQAAAGDAADSPYTE